MRRKKLAHKDYRPIAQVLHHIFTYNILLTLNRRSLADATVYLIDAILNSERIDLPAIIYYMMIWAHDSIHSISSLPHPTPVTQLMKVAKVPFKVTPKGWKDGRAVGHKTLRKMGLIQKATTVAPDTSTLTPKLFRTHFVSMKSTMMGLFHKLVCKVSKVLKNQKILASN